MTNGRRTGKFACPVKPKPPDDRLELMLQANPAIIPRNHRIEQAIEAAMDQEDYGPFEKLLEVLSSLYEEPEGRMEYMLPPKPEEHVLQTFCVNLITPHTNVHIFKFRP